MMRPGPEVCDTRPPFSCIPKGAAEFPEGLVTPAFIIDEAALARNAHVLGQLAKETGCRVLLAQKAFSNYDFYPVFADALAGTEASGLYEARLGRETLPGAECHVFSAAYRDDEFDELLSYADHIVFNSPGQLARFAKKAKAAGKSIGLRINPEKSTQEEHAIYDPCAPGSRLGTTRAQWDAQMTPELVSLLDGLHFHTLCEQDAGPLAVTLAAVEEKFGDVLARMKWLNFGGGHHITRPGYHTGILRECIRKAQDAWGVSVYLEPGEAWALNAGYLACRVLDVTENSGIRLAVLDASAACHMPDVLEMPYRPPLFGAGEPGEKAYTYRLAGPTCLAGDVIGDYSFDRELVPGRLLLFGDMAIYTTCKTNTFNGMPLPAIFSRKTDGTLVKVKTFGYQDFKGRLGR